MLADGPQDQSEPPKQEEPSEMHQPQRVRKSPTKPKISFNNAVNVVQYNKYNDNLLSPPKDNDTEDARISALKVPKKSFKKRTSSTPQE